MSRKLPLFFAAVVIAVFILMSYQSRKGRQVSIPAAADPLNAAQSAARSVTDTFLHPFRVMALREEDNRELRRKLEESLQEKDRLRELLAENRRLKALLDFRESQTSTVAAARVISRSLDNWAHALVIDRGARDGVTRDMAAITPRGLAGKIISASEGYSTILLLTDINFAAAARLQGSRKEGVVSGSGTHRCILKYVPYEEEVKVGEIVITSGLDSLFPPGIPIGYVSKVDSKGKGGNFQYVEVTPFQDDTRMEEVLVVR